MTFAAECPFCHLRLRGVPEDSAGATFVCKRCRNFFTLAAPSLGTTAWVKRRRRRKVSISSATQRDKNYWVPSGVLADDLPSPQPEAAETTEAPAALPVRGRPTNFLGLVAFLAASFGLLAAAVPVSQPATRPLAFGALALGFLGLLPPLRKERGRVLPVAGMAFGLMALALVHFRPEWLTPPRPPLGAEGHASLDGVVHLNAKGGQREAAATNWVNLGRDAFQRQDVRVRLLSAGVRAAPLTVNRGNNADVVIRVRITNVGIARRVAVREWRAGTLDGATSLSDNEGNTYRQKPSPPLADALLPPGKFVDQELVFEAPPVGVGMLRLELPGAPIGVTGSLKLEIPEQLLIRH